MGPPGDSEITGLVSGRAGAGITRGHSVQKTKNNTEGNFSEDINLPQTGEVEGEKGHIHFQACTGASDSKSIVVQGQGP